MAPGSNHFDETAGIIAVFIDDIRQMDTPFNSVARVTRQGSAAVMPRWLLDSDDKRGLLELVGDHDEGAAKGGNPKGHPRGFVEPDKKANKAPFEGRLRLKTGPFSAPFHAPAAPGRKPLRSA